MVFDPKLQNEGMENIRLYCHENDRTQVLILTHHVYNLSLGRVAACHCCFSERDGIKVSPMDQLSFADPRNRRYPPAEAAASNHGA